MFGESLPIVTETKKPSPQVKRKTDLFGNDDLFDDAPMIGKPKKPISKPSDPLDDLFDSLPPTSSGPKVKDPLGGDLFGDDEPVQKPVKPVKQEKTLIDDIDDLFDDTDKKPIKQVKPVKPVVDDDDDLFGETGKKPIKQVKPVKPVVDDDDLFGETTKKLTTQVKPVKPVDDDPFDDPIPVKPVEPEKKQDNIEDLFSSPPPLPPEEEDGELFRSLGPTPRKPAEEKKTTPKGTPKTTPKNKKKKVTEEPPPDIFDEPLSTAPTGRGGAPVDDIFASSPPEMKPDKTVSEVWVHTGLYGEIHTNRIKQNRAKHRT